MNYSNGAVSVDGSFARFGSKSYAIDKINTVDVRWTKPGNAIWIICVVIAVTCVVGSLAAPDKNPQIGAAVVFGAIGYLLYKRSRIRTYLLYLVTSSAEAQAFQTKDKDEIDSLRAAIEQAISANRRQA